MTKQQDGSWDLNILLDPADGTVVDGSITGITFGNDRNFSVATGTGLGDTNITILFNGQTTPQTFNIVMDGGNAAASGLTSFSGDASIATIQDGYGNGILTSVQVDTSGIIQGVASNGVEFPIARDLATRLPIIPGSSLKGRLRGLLELLRGKVRYERGKDGKLPP